MTLAGRLPTTRWSLVVLAGDRSTDPAMRRQAQQSLGELCEAYWPALYAYSRRRGRSRADAEDLVQGFFTSLLERETIAAADSTRGRFRAFLYTALDRYAANEHRRQNAVRRGGGDVIFSIDQRTLDEAERGLGSIEIPDHSGDPASIFDREWAQCLIRQTINELRQDYIDQGKGDWFDRLAPMLTTTDVTPDTRQRIARELGLTATALKVAIHRLRAKYRERLLDALAQTVEHPSDCGSERQLLFSAFEKNSISM